MQWWEDPVEPGFIVIKYGHMSHVVQIVAADAARDVAAKLNDVCIGDDFFLRAKIVLSEKTGRLEGYRIYSYSDKFEAYFVGPQKTADLMGLPVCDDTETIKDFLMSPISDLNLFLKYAVSEQTASALTEIAAAANALKEHTEASPGECLIAAAIAVSGSRSEGEQL